MEQERELKVGCMYEVFLEVDEDIWLASGLEKVGELEVDEKGLIRSYKKCAVVPSESRKIEYDKVRDFFSLLEEAQKEGRTIYNLLSSLKNRVGIVNEEAKSLPDFMDPTIMHTYPQQRLVILRREAHISFRELFGGDQL